MDSAIAALISARTNRLLSLSPSLLPSQMFALLRTQQHRVLLEHGIHRGRSVSGWGRWLSGERGAPGGEHDRPGLLELGLFEPEDWKRLASETERACRGLVDDVIAGSASFASGSPPSTLTSTPSTPSTLPTTLLPAVRLLDEVSDVLCRTIDAAEFCRHVHRDEGWRRAAHEACGQLGAFVHELNTHYGLYTALCRCLDGGEGVGVGVGSGMLLPPVAAGGRGGGGDHHHQRRRIDAEYRYVGEMLRRDFERFGVHLEGAVRDEMTSLVGLIQQAGHVYMMNAIDRSKTGQVVVDVGAMGAERVQRRAGGKKSFSLPAGVFTPVSTSTERADRTGTGTGTNALVASGDSNVCSGLLAHCDSEVVRKAAFRAYHAYPAENAELVDQIVKARYRVAEIMGYRSFGGYQLDGFSLAGMPGAVEAFLTGMNGSIRGGVEAEMGVLEAFKASVIGGGGRVEAWDREWATNGTLAEQRAVDGSDERRLHRLVRVSGFVSGMSALLTEAMGLRLVSVPLGPGEAWASGIGKVLVVNDADGETYGTIYLDLLQRPGKFGGAALFTLRCGRRLSNGEYQLPKVALVANISTSSAADGYLSFSDLETLCHEFGHAMHSVLSRTELQHLSGTRGPQDIIEVPSHVFERFASDRRALSLMVEHSGGDPCIVDDQLIGVLESRRRHCAATKLQKTVHTCLLDQYMHGEGVLGSDFGSKRDIERFMRAHGASGSNDELTAFPPLRFTHLVGYAGNYYAYLFANCIAAEVWDGGGGRGEGAWPSRALMRDTMLQTGGSIPAKAYVRELVGADGLVDVDGGCFPRHDAFLAKLGLKS